MLIIAKNDPQMLPFSAQAARDAMEAAKRPYCFTGVGFQLEGDATGRLFEAIDILIDNATGEVKRHGDPTEVRDFVRRLQRVVEQDADFEAYFASLSLMTFPASEPAARRINLSLAYPDFALSTYAALRAEKAAIKASI